MGNFAENLNLGNRFRPPLSFLFVCQRPHDEEVKAKPLEPPAKDSLPSSFPSGGLPRLRRSCLISKPSLWQRLIYIKKRGFLFVWCSMCNRLRSLSIKYQRNAFRNIYIFNPCYPEGFSETYFPKGVVATPLGLSILKLI